MTPSLSNFVNQFNLYDRGLDSVRRVEGEVEFTFSLFHCDDTQRDDENKEYVLVAVFAERYVSTSDERLFSMTLQQSAEVLEFKFDGQTLTLGISWQAPTGHDWTSVKISGDPLRVQENVTPRQCHP